MKTPEAILINPGPEGVYKFGYSKQFMGYYRRWEAGVWYDGNSGIDGALKTKHKHPSVGMILNQIETCGAPVFVADLEGNQHYQPPEPLLPEQLDLFQ